VTTLFLSDLYERGLINPVRSGADRLLVVSGYASPIIASQLLTDALDQFRRKLAIEIVVGMTGKDGVPMDMHRGFESLLSEPRAELLKVAYMPTGRAVHTKLYVWLRGDEPMSAFVGSSNFTQNGFLVGVRNKRRDELLTQVAVDEALAEYQRVEGESISIDNPSLWDEVEVRRRVTTMETDSPLPEDFATSVQVVEAEHVILPLVMKNGNVHLRSGLNWGQRPGREPNQAYIPVPSTIAQLGFFPPRGVQFLVLTDDDRAIIMVVAQDGNKALESPQGNHLIGEYFRNRLGVANGAPVTAADLARFGSRFVKFYKTDDESYFMEFSPSVEREGEDVYG